MPTKTMLKKSEPQVRSGAVLACGHPGQPNNLKGGACGTCWMVTDLERMAKETSTPKLRRILRSLANQFRSGNVLYDTNGKSFLEWEKTMRPQANDGAMPRAVNNQKI